MVKHALKADSELASSQPDISPSSAMPTSQQHFYDRVLLFPTLCNSKEYEPWKKYFFTGIVSLAAVAAPLQSNILLPALSDISTYFQVSRSLVNLSVAFYILAMGIIPLWWSVISELYGRRPVYLISFAIFVVWNVVSAESTSISMLIVMRVLCGGASASVQAVGAGTVADLWEVERRGQAMGYFFLGPMVGPLVSPILGGILTEKVGWRATQWATVVYGAIVWLLILFCLPETSQAAAHKPPSSSYSNQEGSKAILSQIRRIFSIFLEPFKILAYLQFPPVLLTVYYASSTFACYYAVSITLQTLFSEAPYSFSPIIVGLVYIPCALGSIVASLLGGRWTDHIMRRRAKSAGRLNSETGQIQYLPGDRMGENAWLASVIYPAAGLWFGWTIDKGIFWLVPCIATFFFGLGSSTVFSMTSTMLTELLPGRTSTGVALNNVLRNALACLVVVVMQPLIDAIGPRWIFTGLAVIGWASVGILWLFRWNAVAWAADMERKLANR
ncbi:hypothetical protein ASPACDRAFT_39929 [Aspergillus aculeatus ATCC 16872]|uniref:Major facilitator superfamily (MFS) profile domain-containing protein n=1 Tax=Aspergillus aculeatus (strain ATCC 16872 / CBS 172.66 / WB 5094) TaxID=690307 RepID=A0A1L9X2S6_ASPA1|nr:uncharacterized protein ASPACDRAFT_39929 [Aspergillus aculeatus ATCC 16872]OJK02619.1 hypothetical protein ASPACDRAFT_39929 [Aspergillus aculeatus ATCC 16872]